MRFRCPKCDTTLKVAEAMAGRRAKCPGCGQVFTVPSVSGAAPDRSAAEAVQTQASKQEEKDTHTQSSEPNKKAQQKTHSCGNRKQAEQQKDKWKAELPPVQSAYHPSGKLPPRALGLMVLGSIVGVPVGALAGGLTLGVGTLLAALCGAVFMGIKEVCNVVACCPVILLFLVAIITYFGMFVAIGVASGVLITEMGKLGKNRNANVPTLLSAVSSFVAVFAFWFIVPRMATDIDNSDLEQAYSLVFKMEGFGLVCLIVGLIVAVVSAVLFALYRVLSAKFCEKCEVYMEHRELPPVTFEGAKDLANLVATSAIADIPGLPRPISEREGTVALFFCPQCGIGYVEATVTYSATWPSGDSSQNMSESWLVASRALSANDVNTLRGLTSQ